MANPTLPTTATEALALVMTSTFRDFTSHDWAAYAGCETQNPKIAEREDGMTIVVDGPRIEFLFYDAEGNALDAFFLIKEG